MALGRAVGGVCAGAAAALLASRREPALGEHGCEGVRLWGAWVEPRNDAPFALERGFKCCRAVLGSALLAARGQQARSCARRSGSACGKTGCIYGGLPGSATWL